VIILRETEKHIQNAVFENYKIVLKKVYNFFSSAFNPNCARQNPDWPLFCNKPLGFYFHTAIMNKQPAWPVVFPKALAKERYSVLIFQWRNISDFIFNILV
jgi:hypothetical protein